MRIKEILKRSNYQLSCRFFGNYPTLKEIENPNVKQLATKFKATSDKDTLTNVLEWQDRNVQYWPDRWIPATLFWVLLVPTLLLIYAYLFPVFSFLLWPVVIFITSIVTVLSLIIANLKLIWKLPLWAGLKNVLLPSISVDFLIHNKLAICRDYAKITACLLFNIYKDSELYFVYAQSHVATAIMIENELYVLDKYLPVVTLEKWHQRWHPHKYSPKRMEKISGNEVRDVKISSFISKTKSTEIDLKELAKNMQKLLGIKESNGDKSVSFVELTWKKGKLLYENNEIVNYSLAKLLSRKISNELIPSNQIEKIEAFPCKDDLVFRVRYIDTQQNHNLEK